MNEDAYRIRQNNSIANLAIVRHTSLTGRFVEKQIPNRLLNLAVTHCPRGNKKLVSVNEKNI